MAIIDITKPMALDETLQGTNDILETLATDATLQTINTALGLLSKDATLQLVVTALSNIGLNNVGNLSQLTTEQKTSLVAAINELVDDVDDKVDKEAGKGLSTNDYTTSEKNKLAGITVGATKTASSTTNGNIKIDDVETQVYDDSDITSAVSGILSQIAKKTTGTLSANGSITMGVGTGQTVSLGFARVYLLINSTNASRCIYLITTQNTAVGSITSMIDPANITVTLSGGIVTVANATNYNLAYALYEFSI